MVTWTIISAQAEFKANLQAGQPWTLEIDNTANTGASGVTIYYLGRRDVDFDIHTVPAGNQPFANS